MSEFDLEKLNELLRLEAQKVKLLQALETVRSTPTVLDLDDENLSTVQHALNEWYRDIEKRQDDIVLKAKELLTAGE